MAKNVNEQMQQDAPGLGDKIVENIQLANLYMGLLGRMITESLGRSKPIEGVTIGAPQFIGMTMRARVMFGSLHRPVSAEFIQNRYAKMGDFVEAKARGLSRAMQRNPEFVKFFNSLVGAVEQMAAHKLIPFDKISVSSAILDRDDCIVVTFADGRLPS